MTRKQVSVRLSPEGGDRTKREFREVGQAGDRAFRNTSLAVQQANRRLAAFARTAGIVAATTAAAAAAGGAAAVRSSLQTVDAQAKLAQSLDTTVASIQVVDRAGELAGVSLGEIEQATIQLTRRLSQAAAGTGPAVAALDDLRLSAEELQALPLDERIAAIQNALEEYVPASQRAAVASQLFGDRAGLTFSRIDTSTLRQAQDDVRNLGVALSETDADQIERTNDALSRLALAGTGLANQLTALVAPALESIADGLVEIARVGSPLNDAFRLIFGNLDRVAITAGTFVAFLAGRWVIGMTAAAVSTIRLAGTLTVLRGALIRTGIGALVVVVGELAYRLLPAFSRGLDGVTDVLVAVKDVGVEVFDRISQSIESLVPFARGAAGMLKSLFLDAFASVLEKFNEITGSIAENWTKLMALLGIDVDVQGLAGELAKQLRASADQAREFAVNDFKNGNFLFTDAFRPLDSLNALREALAETGTESSAVSTEIEELEEVLTALENTAGGAAGGVSAVDKELTRVGVTLENVRDGAARTFSDIVLGTTKASEALRSLFNSVAGNFLQGAFQTGFNALFPSIGANAQGTDFWRGGLTWVGEEGPEIVNLPRGSQVFSAPQSAQMAGGGTTVTLHMPVSLTVNGGDGSVVEGVMGALQQFEADLDKRIRAVITNAASRGMLS